MQDEEMFDGLIIQKQDVEKSDVGTCVLRTLESLLSDSTGDYVYLDNDAVMERKMQMIKSRLLTQKKVRRAEKLADESDVGYLTGKDIEALDRRYRKVTTRMDQIAVHNFIDSLKSRDDDLGRRLNGVEIKYKRGDLKQATTYMDEGWQVGVITEVSAKEIYAMHVFHLKKGPYVYYEDEEEDREENYEAYEEMWQQERLYDASDKDIEEKVVNNMIFRNQLDTAMKNSLNMTKGWNLILMRKKG